MNQLYGPDYISAGGKPDYRSDLLAIRFASFNPILDPWVYILCRKNLLLKGCEKLKTMAARLTDAKGDLQGWGVGRLTPSSLRSNDTSCASVRAAAVAVAASSSFEPFGDLAMKQAWDYDTSRHSFHPFSVQSTAVTGCEEDVSGDSQQDAPCRTCPEPKPPLEQHMRQVDVVTCTFSTPTSCQSIQCL